MGILCITCMQTLENPRRLPLNLNAIPFLLKTPSQMLAQWKEEIRRIHLSHRDWKQLHENWWSFDGMRHWNGTCFYFWSPLYSAVSNSNPIYASRPALLLLWNLSGMKIRKRLSTLTHYSSRRVRWMLQTELSTIGIAWTRRQVTCAIINFTGSSFIVRGCAFQIIHKTQHWWELSQLPILQTKETFLLLLYSTDISR